MTFSPVLLCTLIFLFPYVVVKSTFINMHYFTVYWEKQKSTKDIKMPYTVILFWLSATSDQSIEL